MTLEVKAMNADAIVEALERAQAMRELDESELGTLREVGDRLNALLGRIVIMLQNEAGRRTEGAGRSH